MTIWYDTECFPNYWLFKAREDSGHIHSVRVFAGQSLSAGDRARIVDLFNAHTAFSFNGRGYDQWMIAAALAGYTTEQLKWLNDQIIVERVKPWQLNLPRWEPRDHIDVMEVAPGAGGQKQYAGRLHAPTMRDLPYSPDRHLAGIEFLNVDQYCDNDLAVLKLLADALAPQIKLREKMGAQYGLDLRSKSDAQVAEAVIRHRCEQALGRRIDKPAIDWSLRFRYNPPAFISFQTPALNHILEAARGATFGLSAKGSVEMPAELKGLDIAIGNSRYKLGIGGLHSSEEGMSYRSDDNYILRDVDVASYYPSLILNSGEYPLALGPVFLDIFRQIKDERLHNKHLQKSLDKSDPRYADAEAGNEGGKIMINGTFGKTGSPYSVLFAPQMLIQTTLTGQLALLMLIEWHELSSIPIVSANTDGIVINCPRDRISVSEALVKEWERRTGLEMEATEYASIHSHNVNNYIAIKSDGSVKRKGEFGPGKSGPTAYLTEKRNPSCEICADAVADYLAKGAPLATTITQCRDIRKFVAIQNVAGGALKLWGDGVMPGTLVRDMPPRLLAHGWAKAGRYWERDGMRASAADAYAMTFAPQRPEPLGKVIRWYYGTRASGPIVYASNGNLVGKSYGAMPCMELPTEFPDDVDFAWYTAEAEEMLNSTGVTK